HGADRGAGRRADHVRELRRPAPDSERVRWTGFGHLPDRFLHQHGWVMGVRRRCRPRPVGGLRIRRLRGRLLRGHGGREPDREVPRNRFHGIRGLRAGPQRTGHINRHVRWIERLHDVLRPDRLAGPGRIRLLPLPRGVEERGYAGFLNSAYTKWRISPLVVRKSNRSMASSSIEAGIIRRMNDGDRKEGGCRFLFPLPFLALRSRRSTDLTRWEEDGLADLFPGLETKSCSIPPGASTRSTSPK